MRVLRFTPHALSDLASISTCISGSSGSRRTSSRFISKLKARCKKRARLRQALGSARPGFGTGLGRDTGGNYVIILRDTEKSLDIAAAVEQHRDIEAVLGERDDEQN